MASRRIHIDAQTFDILRFDADVIALKFQGHLSGATQHVARALGLSVSDLQLALPSEGMVHVVPGDGKIAARHAVFLRVPPPSKFTYQHVRQFNADILRALRTHLPATRHLAVTMHGVGYDSDLEDSLSANIRGCGDAIRAGDIPDALDAISIVDRRLNDPAAVQRLLADLAPGGGLEVPSHPSTPAPSHPSTPAPPHPAPRHPGTQAPPHPPSLASEPPRATAGQAPSLFDIFISFKSEDEHFARLVYDTLTKNGLRVFFSRASLPQLGSDAYHAQIDKAIEHARHMVVVTTAAEHVTSRWVQYEWRLFMGEQLAGHKTGNLITVIAGDLPIKKLPIGLRHLQVLRLDPEGLASLVDFTRLDIDRIGEPGAPEGPPLPVAPTVDLRRGGPSAFAQASADKPGPPGPEAEHLRAGPDLIVAVKHVMWNTSWEEALEHLVASRELDVTKGWRMPTLDELRLIRFHALLPADSCYWSGEEASRNEAHYVHFDDGHAGQGPKTFSNGVAAVFIKKVARAARSAPAPPDRRERTFRLAATFGAPPGIALVRATESGDLIVTGGVDGALRVYDPQTRSRRAVLGSKRYWAARHEGLVTALELSPDGRYAASGHLDGAIHLWDVLSEREIGSLKHEIAIGGLAFAPDGKTLVSGSRDGTVRFWEIAALERGAAPAGAATKPAPVVYLSYLPATSWLVTGLVNTTSARYALQIDKTSRPERTLATINLAAPFKQLAIAADERVLAATGGDGQIRLYDLAAVAEAITRKENPKLLPLVTEFKAHSRAVSSLAFFPDNRTLVTCAMGDTLKLWDLETRQARVRLQADASDAFAGVVVVQNGSMIVSALADGRIRIWEAG